MTARKRQAPRKQDGTSSEGKPKQRDFAREHAELMKLAPEPVTPLEREWHQEGDSFKEFTLYDDERSVVTTTSVMF